MGLIDIIDDRDVFNNYAPSALGELKNIHKELLLSLQAENKIYRVIGLGNGIYKIDIPVINCDGSDIESQFIVPFNHNLVKMELKHTASDLTDSTNPLEYRLYRRTAQNLLLLIYQELKVLKSDVVDEFIGYSHEPCQYLIVTNSTNTDKLFMAFYARWIGD